MATSPVASVSCDSERECWLLGNFQGLLMECEDECRWMRGGNGGRWWRGNSRAAVSQPNVEQSEGIGLVSIKYMPATSGLMSRLT